MTTQTSRFRYLPLLIAGFAVVLFSTAGVARIAGLFSIPTGDSRGLFAFAGLPATAAEVSVEVAQTVPQRSIDAKSAKAVGRGKGRCATCGVIVSVVEIKGNEVDRGTVKTARLISSDHIETPLKLTQRFRITIRMSDESIRAIDEASPANWRLGEQVTVIAGTNPSK